jgi:hypothetical protein
MRTVPAIYLVSKLKPNCTVLRVGWLFHRYITLLLSCNIGVAFHPICPFLQDNQAIASTTWMVILSIIPSDLVRVGAITLGSIVFLFNIARAVRPRVLMQKLQVRLLSLEGKLQTAVDENIMAETDANYIAQFERSVGRWVSMLSTP